MSVPTLEGNGFGLGDFRRCTYLGWQGIRNPQQSLLQVTLPWLVSRLTQTALGRFFPAETEGILEPVQEGCLLSFYYPPGKRVFPGTALSLFPFLSASASQDTW
jgi:hypothetical protein